mmetsp:Transcript_16279/g.44161  ORF Transcript_16279/g.44161 Transcript_16279/m.44161 type:complete len:101 (-) Transcript_16279:2278-2580(-)
MWQRWLRLHMLASRDKLAGSNVELKEIGLQRPSHDVQLVHLGLELVKLRVMDLHSKIGNYVNIGASSRFICSNYKEGPRFGNYLYFSDDALPIAALQQRE